MVIFFSLGDLCRDLTIHHFAEFCNFLANNSSELHNFGPDVIKKVEAVEKYAQEKDHWPKQKDWNEHAAQQGFYSAGTLIYWVLLT